MYIKEKIIEQNVISKSSQRSKGMDIYIYI
jgi:hypothetical protein